MDPFIVKAIQLLLSLSLLIVLHELGHFIPAKLFKTRVEKFFLFFDVKFALFKKKIGGTEYGIGWLPLGGYVKISGMIDESMDKEQMAKPPEPWEFRSKPAWQRLIIMLGGVTVNLVLGFLIYMMIMFVWGKNYVGPDEMPKGFAIAEEFKQYGFQDGDRVLQLNGEDLQNSTDVNRYLFMRDVNNITVLHQNGEEETIEVPEDIGEQMWEQGVMLPFIPIQNPVIEKVTADKAAEIAGLQKGDSIISVNEQEIGYWHEIGEITKDNKEKEIELVFKRDNDIKSIMITPDEEGMLGFSIKSNYEIKQQKYGFVESIKQGFDYGYWTLHDYVAQFKYVFTQKGATQLGGFGAIGGMFPDTWDWKGFWHTTALISIILAFMNILPIPALDGGHVMFLLYEMVTGRKPNDKFMEVAQMVGFFILIALVLYANGNDVYRWLFE
ncbi:RIP metalloprotease RseP [Salegentibacter salarius]|uniref:Zinc metalloprotease n=1 Tax=Salegentibacter salarius TaxID=435906 RepID=A0A2N0TLX8_9FLAO|nr:RIP metalloprotease RseP [Salegentibacter salarius]OEY71254.1 RIP metalloprotease RseP [Salegentibacter salarius]PKD15750.1 RIP metalloprotease RseP [Salegentibacter salarius]SLJ92206.1 regulator of sigma E protease [Salegentibacter salarius]